MNARILTMHGDDSVGIALRDLDAGDLATTDLRCTETVPKGHKIALQNIKEGTDVRKYGHVIGTAMRDIAGGEYVHTHNLAYGGASAADTAIGAAAHGTVDVSPSLPRTFFGYPRPDGRAGTRNYVGVMATVNCSTTVVARIARHFENSAGLHETNIDGVIPITHQGGCGIPASGGAELTLLQRVLRGYLQHPNFCGWVIVGLGCEVNQLTDLLNTESDTAIPIAGLEIQEVGGTTAAIDAGIGCVRELIAQAAHLTRSEMPLSALTLGLQCGGSDAWSGVTANPALGAAVDQLVAAGGSAILAETPEIHGAEVLLKNRAIDSTVADALQGKIDWWHDYLARHNQSADSNPSPGNLAGGITTILEKSLGAVAKGGSAPLTGVLDYGAPLNGNGLWFMDSPGYDPCSVTGEVAAGANLVCFTTGRGSTFGATGAPTLKLASNSELYTRMPDDMDIDCGGIASGAESISAVGERVLRAVIDVASGKQTNSERHGLGTFEFVPWAPGAVV